MDSSKRTLPRDLPFRGHDWTTMGEDFRQARVEYALHGTIEVILFSHIPSVQNSSVCATRQFLTNTGCVDLFIQNSAR